MHIQQALHKYLFLFGVILAAHVEEEVKAQRSKDSPRQRSETEYIQPDSQDTQASSTAAEETVGPVNVPAPDKQYTEQ